MDNFNIYTLKKKVYKLIFNIKITKKQCNSV